MNKETFLRQLKVHLSSLDEEDIKEILEEYRLLIEEKLALGVEEEAVIQELGSPKKIAEGYIVELLGEDALNQIHTQEQKEFARLQMNEKNQSNKNIALFIVLQIFHISILFPFALGVIGTLFGFGIAGLSLLIASGTVVFLSLGIGLKILVLLFLLSIGLLLVNLTIALSIFIYKITKRYVLWNIRLIQ